MGKGATGLRRRGAVMPDQPRVSKIELQGLIEDCTDGPIQTRWKNVGLDLQDALKEIERLKGMMAGDGR